MEGRNFRIENGCGWILFRRRSGGAHKMVLHPIIMMKKIWP